MKKRIFAALVPLFYFLYSLLFPPLVGLRATPTVAADGSVYACIRTDEAFFYATKSERNGLFLLPRTYFVKVLSVDTDFCKIEYLYDGEYTQKLTGYAKTDTLTFVDYEPKTPYLYHLFEVRYTIDGAFSTDESFLDQITVTCAYYGDYKIGSETYCYVLRGDSFGYIPKPSTLYVEENPEYADRLAQTPTAPPSDTAKDEGMSAAQIALLVVLCLLVPVLAALVLKTSKRHAYDPDDSG